ncbi:hypothetical protein VOLCADRAFT_116157 [Volvox carteri f. nagariensis]|uniref:FAD/NAD(P)-binding domain-containing protein n=1 Tax=Volvox carteri f. nagariensis TaxID=3068 RepID=D8TJU2_VOLCA|nr:uncharacterized protein VOLCADRAFT_116157 [Volvox carteri f. nagariensis]EFJ51949.1 hypothetical protein VOLCADRAFT_116157 [Volvox carteri f. nagariensis]|eukprot:XP_002946723.1 hypothetical protein VOLCADRAFT_116157 [Volvox carteri f. nagariensis]
MRYVVLGGGIAGVCCALELARCLKQQQQQQPGQQPQHPTPPSPADEPRREVAPPNGATAETDHIILVSSSSAIKGVREVTRLSRLVEELEGEVVETPLEDLAAGEAGRGVLQVLRGIATGLDLQARVLKLLGGNELRYDKLCLCTGARPKELDVPGSDHPAVLTLRDTDSVQELTRRLRGCRRVVLAGNGGIAMELAGALMQLHDPLQHPPYLPPPYLPPPRPPAPPPPPGAAGGGGAPTSVASPPLGPTPSEVERAAAAAAEEEEEEEEEANRYWGERQQRQEDQRQQQQGQGQAQGQAQGQRAEVVWVLKHGHVGDAFFDLDAAQFLLQERLQPAAEAAAAALPAPPPAPPPAHSGGGGSGSGRCTSRGGSSISAPTRNRSEGEGEGEREEERERSRGCVTGHAAGPAWTKELIRGLATERESQPRPAAAAMPAAAAAGRAPGGGSSGGGSGGGGPANFRLVLEFSTTVARIDAGGGDGGGGEDEGTAAGGDSVWPVHVTLSNGKVYGADLVVCGIGVVPATEWLPPELTRGSEGGVAVDRRLRSSDPHVFAAGDCCSAQWPDGSPHWFQMRLWTQVPGCGMGGARVMGSFAAHSMLRPGVEEEEEEEGDDNLACGFNFELFTHVTRFLGAKVVLLGLYNGQRLENEPAEDIRMYSRTSPAADGSGNTFVRVLLLRGRMQGAVLIGETELEEVSEEGAAEKPGHQI